VAARPNAWVLRPLVCWDWGFESSWGHGYLSVMIVVCCQVVFPTSGLSLVQRSPTEGSVPWMWYRNLNSDDPWVRPGLLGHGIKWEHKFEWNILSSWLEVVWDCVSWIYLAYVMGQWLLWIRLWIPGFHEFQGTSEVAEYMVVWRKTQFREVSHNNRFMARDVYNFILTHLFNNIRAECPTHGI
jgi:hypothetical protein